MPEGITAENLLNNIMDTLHDGIQKQKSGSFFEEDRTSSVTCQLNRLFGRQKPLHHVFGGGKSADVLLWRNKKISASVLTGATAIWILFEWLNYHFLGLVCFALGIGMLVQFVWTNASGVLNRSRSDVPRLDLPDELFVNIATSIGSEINRGLSILQDIACGGNFKQFLVAILSMWAAAMIGSCCNFLTVLYIGFVAAHTLPVLYEKYEDQVDSFADNALRKLQNHYKKLDSGVLKRIPTGKFMRRKGE